MHRLLIGVLTLLLVGCSTFDVIENRPISNLIFSNPEFQRLQADFLKDE